MEILGPGGTNLYWEEIQKCGLDEVSHQGNVEKIYEQEDK